MHDLAHDLDLSYFSPWEAEQAYQAYRYLFEDGARLFGFNKVNPFQTPSLLEKSAYLDGLAFFVNANNPSLPSLSQDRDLADRWCTLFGKPNRTELLYSFWQQLLPDSWFTMMNWGYAYFNDEPNLCLSAQQAHWRYPLQLYARTAQFGRLEGKLLEVGCGRGGGLAFLQQQHGFDLAVGLDSTKSNIRFCRETHHEPRLQFVHGDAHHLPFESASFDTVLNIESCQHYADVGQFLSECQRVLRPGGVLTLSTGGLPGLFSKILALAKHASWQPVWFEDISLNVYSAVEQFDVRALVLSQQTVRRRELYIHFLESTYHISKAINRPFGYYTLVLSRP